MRVADVALNGTDAAGAQIEEVYARNPPVYAVYRTRDRVMVHYADAVEGQAAQRKTLAALNPLRGEINGLVDGWRSADKPRLKAKARQFDRRVADSLIVALEGDVATASSLLQQIKDDAKDERVSWARFQYLLVASAAADVTVVVIGFLTSAWFARAIPIFPIPPESQTAWLAAAAGAVGAFFSIAIGIRNRTVLPDLRMRDNAADGVLRIVIGVIAAVLLVALVQSNLVGLKVGDVAISADQDVHVGIIAFIAGFFERLVPDLLAKSAAVPAPSPPPKPPVVTPTGGGVPPGGGVAPPAPPPAPDSAPAADPVDDVTDACLCDADKAVGEHEATADAELPVAVGGVAASA